MLVFGKAKGEPRLSVSIHEDAREIALDPDKVLAHSARRINLAEQPLKIIVSDGLLIFRQRLPFGRIGQRIAEVIGCAGGSDEEKRRVKYRRKIRR